MKGSHTAVGQEKTSFALPTTGGRPPAERGLVRYTGIQVLLDVITLALCWRVTAGALPEHPLYEWGQHLSWVGDWVVHAIAWLTAVGTMEMYDPRRWRWVAPTVGRMVGALALSTVVAFGLLELVTNIPDHVRATLLQSALLFALVGSMSRLALHRVIPAEVIARRFLLVGDDPGACELVSAIRDSGDRLLVCAGLVPIRGESAEACADVVRSDLLEAEAFDRKVTDLVLCMDASPPDDVARRLSVCAVAGMRVLPLSETYGQITGKAAVFSVGDDEWHSSVRWVETNAYATRIKRILDVIVAAVLAVVALPVVLRLARLVSLESPGGPFFSQERVGHRGRVLRVYKQRTWTVTDANGQQRMTRLGRVLRASRLDELPQLVHVLRGEMSLVGPRPEQPHLVERYVREVPLYNQRHLVRPGLTGWAQVNQSYAESVDDVASKVQYDLFYISKLSFRLDVLVALRTVAVIAKKMGDRGETRVPER